MTDIFPTHTCFDDAMEFIAELFMGKLPPPFVFSAEAIRRDFVVVHAIVRAPSGELFAHGWVEHLPTNVVWFQGIVEGERCAFSCPREEYFAHLPVVDETRYTVAEAAIEHLRSGGHRGPWLERYQALCGSDRKIFGGIPGKIES